MEKRKQAQNWRLRQARERRGWTQKDVADQIELPDVRTLRRWEAGEASPSLRYRARLCELFALSAEELGLIPNVNPRLLAQEDQRHPESPQLSVEDSKYQIPQQVGLVWIEDDHILPLLDGLDEVSPALRQACVDAINAYRRQHGLMPLVLCSRREDYLTNYGTLCENILPTFLISRKEPQMQPTKIISWSWTRARKNVSSSLITAMFLAGTIGIIGGLLTRFLTGLGFGIIVTALFGLLSFLIISFLTCFLS